MIKTFIRKLFSIGDNSEIVISLDSPETTLKHREIILKKPFLKKIYDNWYDQIALQLNKMPQGVPVLEIGSGGGFFKEKYPDVITSDILPLKHCDRVIDAQNLPMEDESLGAIVMVNVFHHLPDCNKFLTEAQRTLTKGGKIVMIEPSNCFWSRMIYRNFHHETFDPSATAWNFQSLGPLSSSNQALPYIVFERDYPMFLRLFPSFEIAMIKYHSPVSYLLSGGVSMLNIVPDFMIKTVIGWDQNLASKRFHMFCTIVIEKK